MLCSNVIIATQCNKRLFFLILKPLSHGIRVVLGDFYRMEEAVQVTAPPKSRFTQNDIIARDAMVP